VTHTLKRKRNNLPGRKQLRKRKLKTHSKSPNTKIPKRKTKTSIEPGTGRIKLSRIPVRKSNRSKTRLPVELGLGGAICSTVHLPITEEMQLMPIPIIIKEEILEDFVIPEETQIKTEEGFTNSFLAEIDGTEEFTHVCPYCYKSFARANELEDHAACNHAEYIELRPNFNCPHLYCSEKLASLFDLKEHQRTQHQLKAL